MNRGGRLNGTMLRAGLIDEVSVLLAPVVDGRMGTAALFDLGELHEPVERCGATSRTVSLSQRHAGGRPG